MVEYGGKGGIELQRKTAPLYNAYKMLDRARREILCSRPRPEYLLPADGKKIKADLKDDQVESR